MTTPMLWFAIVIPILVAVVGAVVTVLFERRYLHPVGCIRSTPLHPGAPIVLRKLFSAYHDTREPGVPGQCLEIVGTFSLVDGH